jgi:hypothetical protein
MAIKRKLEHIDTPPAKPGFLGAGHLARAIIQRDFSEADPFILLMDDMLDKKDNSPAGGPHPHAGFETVTLVLEGEIGEGRHAMKTGDFQIMTAGSGIIHTETIEKPSKLRIMQLWLNLPKAERWTSPGLQELPFEQTPSLEEDGVSIRVYSGSIAGLQSPIKNHVPLLLADINMKPYTSTIQQIPANFNSFLYVLEGSVKIGEDEKQLKAQEVGWLNLVGNDTLSELKLQTTEAATRILLYAAKPLGEPIMSHGPFIADTAEEITQLYRDYRSGKMEHI